MKHCFFALVILSSTLLTLANKPLHPVPFSALKTKVIPGTTSSAELELSHPAIEYDEVIRPQSALNPCLWDTGRVDSFTTALENGTLCPGNTITPPILDSALTAHGWQYYVPVAQGPVMPLRPQSKLTVQQLLTQAFALLPKGRTRLDSLEVVVNLVYVAYTYNHHTTVTSTNIDSMFSLLETAALSGDCGNNSHYANLIIKAYFPWWGTTVELNSNTSTTSSSCAVSHVFDGLANSQGKILYVFDCTVNAVWCDSLTGRALSLDSLTMLLHDSTRYNRVVKRNHTFFGSHNRGIGDLSCACVTWLMFPDSIISIQTARSVPPSNSTVVISPWQQFDLLSEVNYKYYWQMLGFPGNTWANNILTIKAGCCYNAGLIALISQNYGFPVTQIP